MTASRAHTAVYAVVCPYCPRPHALAVASPPHPHAGARGGWRARATAHAASRRLLRAAQAPFRPRWQARFIPTTGLLRARARAWLAVRAAYRELSS